VTTIDEAATQLGVSRETVRRRIRDGTLAATLVSGRYEIDLPEEATTTSPDRHTEANDRVVELLHSQVAELRQDKDELRRQIDQLHQEIMQLHQLMGQKQLESVSRNRWWLPWRR